MAFQLTTRRRDSGQEDRRHVRTHIVSYFASHNLTSLDSAKAEMLTYMICALLGFMSVAVSPAGAAPSNQLVKRSNPVEILGFEIGGPGQHVNFVKTLQIVYNTDTGLFEAGRLAAGDYFQHVDVRCRGGLHTGIVWTTADSKGNNVEIDFVLYHHVAVTVGFRIGDDSYDGDYYFNGSHLPFKIFSSRGVVANRHLFPLDNYGAGTW
ncbi:uncharacterized protein L969DRAFT_47111 [Mixia osmundae IAM 14324]|uniref:Uncharacterized protein n=1 Tax=Mixia osmundae (strain CBS 9802 / IAM 14324 / JCM 22182 / KY 12970) TaxID=764103 RepID=G7E6B1_MIXOS|nr:uncharacterized protein L969DRAFT_47111 [Mixia osmundae IAM 14324]KEI40473.1 hypothetical protein L969DRAFT_47111 [Mixia osmundae IAM 14324]GAA98371.1 hypothetical protein E5Q_05057 [Mixia osmundae IAM 14324]